MSNTSKPVPETRVADYRLWVDGQTLPSAILDCASSEVLAANAGGRDALGLSQSTHLPLSLDSAMPAMAVLRQLTLHGLNQNVSQHLVFWRLGKLSNLMCNVGPAGQSCKTHVAVHFPDADGLDAEVTLPIAEDVSHPRTTAIAANDDAPPRVIRDDAETLKEIARRIREGHSINVPPRDRQQSMDDRDKPEMLDEEAARHKPATDATPSPWDQPRNVPIALPRRDVPRSILPDELSKLAHELKTPLTAIAAAAEIMRDEQLGAMGNAKYLTYAADIHDSANHALAVIASMLSANPMGSGDSSGLEIVDLNDIAARSVSALQPLATQRNLTLDLDGEPGLATIHANPTAIRQILLNLLTNALKFTPRGGDIRVVTGYLNDGAIFLAVRDTGDGMTETEITNAFDDVRPVHLLRPGGGRGIGLQIVRYLAAENGATINIDSAPGKGTVVLVAFAKDLAGTP